MEFPIEMNTLSQVLEKLRQNGIENEIVITDHLNMESTKVKKRYRPEDLLIVKSYRFEGMSDPADNAVLYIVKDKEGEMSYLLDAYGTYSNNEGPEYDDFLKKIPFENRDEQELAK